MALFERHGLTKTPEYSVWHGIKDRCLNPNSCNWLNYGARGIKVCDRWKDSFADFYKDMGPRPSSDHSIDRINNNGDYEPGNCRWATITEQVYNRGTSLSIEMSDGSVLNTSEAMSQLNMKKGTFFTRLLRGKQLSSKIGNYNQKYPYKGKFLTAIELSKLHSVSPYLIRSRIASGWDPVRAATLPANKVPKFLIHGKLLTVLEICELFQIKPHSFRYHIRLGKSPEETVDYLLRWRK